MSLTVGIVMFTKFYYFSVLRQHIFLIIRIIYKTNDTNSIKTPKQNTIIIKKIRQSWMN